MKPQSLFDIERFGVGLALSLGYAIEDPIPVTLGDADGVLQPPEDDRDDENVYYFHELPNGHPFRGTAANSGQSPIGKHALKAGNVVYVKHDPVNSVWVLSGIAPKLGDFAIDEQDDNEPQPIQLNQFIPGLLDQTDPATMQARVMAAPYSSGSDRRYHPTQLTPLMDSSPLDTSGATIDIPTTPGQSLYVLVQLRFETGVLSYKQGSEISAELSHQTVANADAGTGLYLPEPDAANFACGFIRLIYGMTAIQRLVNIFAVQEIFTQSSASDIVSRILVDADGNILVDADGNILLEELP